MKAKKKERKTKNSPCKICVHHIIKLEFCAGIVTHFRENKDADQHKRQDGHWKRDILIWKSKTKYMFEIVF